MVRLLPAAHSDVPRSGRRVGRAARTKASSLVLAAALAVGGGGAASIALAGSAYASGSTLNRTTCIDVVPGDCSGFYGQAGNGIAMQCWTQGPSAYGQYKWFQVDDYSSGGRVVWGYVPAPTVTNQSRVGLCQ
jgi:hypothetical protein